ncbi:hypothetical protein KS4_24070 [Poriferisphaera corsica]|uniref:Uncharacterized protein n=1 Tax=Poriferisphaera corsica TaxID=2528020 RepID=A0A517YVU0_9BACT|nr:hypothetical protein [Poriferisphaera corsica]QDU34339.1 hypothetical protein KS4_24070 [Poriferisphaera corsica]
MKALAVVFILVVIALVGIYYGAGFSTLDPAIQQEQFENNIKVGMPWKDVVDARMPRKMIIINPKAKLGYGHEVKYKQQTIEDYLGRTSDKEGFIFIYNFSAKDVTEVFFDMNGNISYIEHPKTVADLYQGTFHK